MSLAESSFTNKNYSALKSPGPHNFISLNGLFNESMRKAQTHLQNLNVIVRCEFLPDIKGDKGEMTILLDTLISLVVSHPSAGSKLFLYVDCEAENSSDVLDLSLEEGCKRYLIKFYSNILSNENWKEYNKDLLVKCQYI